jgi:general stress protein YciG
VEKQRRGFACMSVEQRTAISRLGGAAVPANKRSFSQDRDLAASAGAVGGLKSRGGGRPKGEDPC